MLQSNLETQLESSWHTTQLGPDAAKLNIYIYLKEEETERRRENINSHTTLWKTPFQPKKGTSGLHPQHVSELLDAGQLCVCVCVWVRAWILLAGGMTPRKIFPAGG